MVYSYAPNSYTYFPPEQTSFIGYNIKYADSSIPNNFYTNPLSNSITSQRNLVGPFTIFDVTGNYGIQ